MLRTLLFAALLSLLALPAAAADLIPAAERAPAADFSLDNLDDDGVSLSEQAGKVVVISFWATWCQPCLQELPHMNDFQREFSDDLVVFAITTDGPETQSEVRSLARRNRWIFQVLKDLDGSVSAQLNPRGTNPFTLFIDRNGRVAAAHEGYASGDEVGYREQITALIAEAAE